MANSIYVIPFKQLGIKIEDTVKVSQNEKGNRYGFAIYNDVFEAFVINISENEIKHITKPSFLFAQILLNCYEDTVCEAYTHLRNNKGYVIEQELDGETFYETITITDEEVEEIDNLYELRDNYREIIKYTENLIRNRKE